VRRMINLSVALTYRRRREVSGLSRGDGSRSRAVRCFVISFSCYRSEAFWNARSRVRSASWL
jgi:hypothetical protein